MVWIVTLIKQISNMYVHIRKCLKIRTKIESNMDTTKLTFYDCTNSLIKDRRSNICKSRNISCNIILYSIKTRILWFSRNSVRSVTYIRSNEPSPRFSELKSSWSIHVASLETNLVKLYLTKLGWFKRHTAVEQPVRRCSGRIASTPLSSHKASTHAVEKPLRCQM